MNNFYYNLAATCVDLALISDMGNSEAKEWIDSANQDNIGDFIPVCGVVNSYGYEEDCHIYLFNIEDENFYEIHGSHCSCYGFEGQFEPEKIPMASLEGGYIDNESQIKLFDFLEKYKILKNQIN